ncbi:MAG: hypothetical protein HY243_19325 [Proteobacteria bacterium]|nr:hypothetical protein [Pseudomonadota bacterium]
MTNGMTKHVENRAGRSASKIFVAAVMLTGLGAGLSGCATSADPNAMALPTTTQTAQTQTPEKPFPQRLEHAMCVRTVSGGEKTNPLWVSKVDNDGFKSALTTSLQSAGLAGAADSCPYQVDANLLGLSQPVIGFDMTVTSHVNYKVYDASGQPFLLATVDAPYTATMGDAFMGVERLKLANEGSIRTSIKMFFDKLRDTGPQ